MLSLAGEALPSSTHSLWGLGVGSTGSFTAAALAAIQADLAETLGVSFQQIQKYEKGVNRVSAARLFAICKALNVSLSSMFERDPQT